MDIPLLKGIYANGSPDFRVSYPQNLVPVIEENGLSRGYLRPAEGIRFFTLGEGGDRGGIVWKDEHYRVSGSKLIKIAEDGTTTILGDVGGGKKCSFAYTFDNLAICSNKNLYYWNGSTLTLITDPDLGPSLDIESLGGYFISTDGENVVVNELATPTSWPQQRYIGSEADPDRIVGLIRNRDEIYVLNRNTIEVFYNRGGSGFPLGRNASAKIERGPVGTHAACLFMESVAFLGSRQNESNAIWLGGGGQTQKISTREIDLILEGYTRAQLADVEMEALVDRDQQRLRVHLPDRTLVYDGNASRKAQTDIWHVLTSGLDETGKYRGRGAVRAYGEWVVGDPDSDAIGKYSDLVSSHWGARARVSCSTPFFYNKGRGGIIDRLEAMCKTGRADIGQDPTIYLEYSDDGETWSNPSGKKAGKRGETHRRIEWRRLGRFARRRIFRLSTDTSAQLSIMSLDADVTGLAY